MTEILIDEATISEQGIVMPSSSEAKWHELIGVLSSLISNYANQKLREGERHNEPGQ
ncbi:hypothetical protein [Alicyclobacillus ferrooxydans]|uniref:hypothetical protein n=1 Tax=Alicyclobacillus ferrooxydans TaxID=471514 RepID=UPI000B1AA7F3|nr:hypothetical protein [Alicyclobacillus ferrooxydans]